MPGLAAKPVIDVQVSLDDPSHESDYVPALASLGLELRSRDDEHRFLRPFSEIPREVQVHVCLTGSAWERDRCL